MISDVVSRHVRATIRAILLVFSLITVAAAAGPAVPVTTTNNLQTAPPIIVIGFVGGFVKHDASTHTEVQVAADLQKRFPSGVYAEVLENHHRRQAYAEIVRLVDTDGNGTLSDDEKRNARIILYGHSWGASAAVTLARELGREGIPVLLTVQVDSVSKPSQNDRVIPSNVSEAANFYQLDGFLHGEPEILAADPEHTRIIGNFRFNYKDNPIPLTQYPWYDRVFMKPHIEIECDPKVWTQVESLIQSKLPPQNQNQELVRK